MQIFKIICTFFFLPLLIQTVQGNPSGDSKSDAQQVLDKLFEAAGNYNTTKPVLSISNENNKVAAYYPGKNAIVLDQKAYDICLTFGKDYIHALAFILSHELSHSFQVEVKKGGLPTNFLSYDHIYTAPTRIEKVADIQGAFTAYLAGYQPEKVVHTLLPKMYEAYGLMGRTIRGYPTLEERQQTTDEVLEINELLIDLFETGNYLVAIGNYEQAITNFEYILKYYQGREIYNNLGVMYILAGMKFYNPVTDKYVYPVELDASTQLEKINKSRGGVTLSEGDRMVRHKMLQKALTHFEKSLRCDKNYQSAKLNHACALSLLEKPEQALAFLDKYDLTEKKVSDSFLADKVNLARGIAKALSGDFPAAEMLFQNVTESNYELHALQARFNIDVLFEKAFTVLTGQTYELPAEFQVIIRSIQMGRMSHISPVNLTENGDQVKVRKENLTSTFTFGDYEGSTVSLIRFKNTLATNLKLDLSQSRDRLFFNNFIPTADGYFIKSEDNDILLKIEKNGTVKEMVRIIRHKRN